MSDLTMKQNAKEIVLEAVITRADGTQENLGSIAYWHRNPLRRAAHRLTHPKSGKIL